MSWWEDNYDGSWDDPFDHRNEYEEDGPIASFRTTRTKTCWYCGKQGLAFNNEGKLVEQSTYNIHKCKQTDKLRQAANDFRDKPL